MTNNFYNSFFNVVKNFPGKVALEFHGISKNKEKGNKKIIDHKVVEVVTFSLILFFSLRVNKPPMQ